MANEKLGLAKEPSPETVWGDFTSVKLGDFVQGDFTFA